MSRVVVYLFNISTYPIEFLLISFQFYFIFHSLFSHFYSYRDKAENMYRPIQCPMNIYMYNRNQYLKSHVKQHFISMHFAFSVWLSYQFRHWINSQLKYRRSIALIIADFASQHRENLVSPITPRGRCASLCASRARRSCVYDSRCEHVRSQHTRVERCILFRGARYNARHARHNGANLFNLTNNKLISWLIRRDGFARHCSGRLSRIRSLCVRCECLWIFPSDQWLAILFWHGLVEVSLWRDPLLPWPRTWCR